MKISAAFPSRWLKAADLQGREREMEIDTVAAEDIGDEEAKPVLYFSGAKKGLVLNKTNAQVIAVAYGDDTNDWHGHRVILFTAKVQFQGNLVDGLRVRIPPENPVDDDDEPPF